MKKFRVMVVNKNGKPIGVRAAQINGRFVYLALRDKTKKMTWDDAVKVGIPTKEEWMAIAENFDAVNKALIRAGGESLGRNWYWSSSEYSSNLAWLSYGLISDSKNYNYSVRPLLAL